MSAEQSQFQISDSSAETAFDSIKRGKKEFITKTYSLIKAENPILYNFLEKRKKEFKDTSIYSKMATITYLAIKTELTEGAKTAITQQDIELLEANENDFPDQKTREDNFISFFERLSEASPRFSELIAIANELQMNDDQAAAYMFAIMDIISLYTQKTKADLPTSFQDQ